MPLCSVEGVRITVDQDLLFNQRQLDVQLIEVNRPKLNLHRASSGKWNWEDLPLLDQQQGAPPIVKVRDAEVILQWEHEQFARAVRVQLKAVDADIVPTGMHRFTFQGTGHEETLGVSQFSGKIDTLHRNWSLAGKLKGLVIDQPFLQAATLLSANANRVVSELKNSRMGNSQNLTGYSNAISGPASEQNSFSLQLTANLEFEISQQAGALPEYTLFADLVNGQLMHPGLPIPLDKIQGRIAVDRLGMRLEQIVLASGKTSAHISGAWGWQAGDLPRHVTEGFDVVLKDYLVTRETRDYLPLGSRRVFDDLSPAGILNTSFFIKRGVGRPFDFDLKTAVISNASMRHRLFSYPVQQIQGIVRRVDNGLGPETWSMNFSGVVSGQPATFTGTLIDPGPDYETEMSVAVNRLPIDKQFYRALRPQDRKILAGLELQGMTDAQCTIVRKLAVGYKPIFRIKADVYDASMRVRSFPLAVDQCSGHVEFDENGWLFTRLEGKHGETQLNGLASVLPQNGDWKLEITASAKQARFDQSLRLACEVASEEITEAWSSLQPRGEFDVT
ncbi:MAG: hypothetical protein JKY95_18275, partial [Planctomycetaceae bacterium]|nr:hypothetical protein [Planctomycetaceae bacterium]